MCSFSSLKDAKMYTKGVCSSGNKVGLRIKGVYLGFESKREKFLNLFEPDPLPMKW